MSKLQSLHIWHNLIIEKNDDYFYISDVSVDNTSFKYKRIEDFLDLKKITEVEMTVEDFCLSNTFRPVNFSVDQSKKGKFIFTRRNLPLTDHIRLRNTEFVRLLLTPMRAGTKWIRVLTSSGKSTDSAFKVTKLKIVSNKHGTDTFCYVRKVLVTDNKILNWLYDKYVTWFDKGQAMKPINAKTFPYLFVRHFPPTALRSKSK